MLPAVMPVVMRSVFRATTTMFGERRGYQAGFAAYWLTCWAGAAAIVGPRRLARTFQRSQRSLPTPRVLSIAVLAFPAMGAVFTEFLPNVRRAGPATTATSIGIGLTNERPRRPSGRLCPWPCPPTIQFAVASAGCRVHCKAPDPTARRRRGFRPDHQEDHGAGRLR